MVATEITERLRQLREEIDHHNYLYHVLDQPEISDSQYDTLMRQLREIEAQHPELVTPDSPTQRVGGQPAEGFAEVQHPVPLLSLANAFDDNEFMAWHRRVANMLERDQFDMVCELKFDGLAVALTYENGVFMRGATRGNGYVGEDITMNLRTIRSIPLRVHKKGLPPRIEIRGEVYFPKSRFLQFNEERIARGEPPYANPRNTAAGSLRQLDPRMTAERPLDIFIYGFGYADDGEVPNNHWDMLRYLKDLGFKVSPHIALAHTPEEVLDYYRAWLERGAELDYACDGMVVKVNRFDYQQHLGFVGREPRWAIAYKFPATQAVTRLINIDVNVGRTGSINPYAIMEPVDVGGAIVRQATLHNEDYIRSKDLRIGDWVVVERAGEVIPQVVSVITSRRTGEEREFQMPAECPSCGEPVARPDGEAMSYCVNLRCPAQIVRLVEHFVSRGAMDIEGIGEKLVSALLGARLIRDAADIYSLTALELLEIKKKTERTISVMWDAVAAAQNLSEEQRQVIKRLTLQVLSNDKEAQVVCDKHGLTLERLRSLKDAVDQALPEVLKATDTNQMTWEHILTLNQSLGEKSVSNLLAAIEKSKSQPLNRVIFALGILHVGSEVAYLLARSFHSMDRLMNATEEDLLNIPAIGPRIADTVVAYFQREENRMVVEKLRVAGVRLEDGDSAEPAEQPLAGMRFVVTGRLQSFSRSQIEGIIKQLGGAVSSSVSRKTSYLVAGEDAGSKLSDAQALGVEVLSEDQFLAMIGNKAE